MNCLQCHSKETRLLKQKTSLGYDQYRCADCGKQFNERTGTPYNFLEFPTDVVVLTVFYYYRFKNSLVDVTEPMALRGIFLSHETVRLWSQKISTEIALKFRARRWGQATKKWHMDITYLKIKGRNAYLYRAIDKEGNLIDIYLSEKRDKKAAKRFFKLCQKTTGINPTQITTDKEPAFPRAIKEALGNTVKHRNSQYMNNRMEQNHRHIKSRIQSMKGFKKSWCAMIFCHTFEEITQFFIDPIKQLLNDVDYLCLDFSSLIKLSMKLLEITIE